MAPKAPEKSPQTHQQHQTPEPVVNGVAIKIHSNPFYISAHSLCRNKRLKQKRSKYAECIRNALMQPRNAGVKRASNKKTEVRRQRLSLLTAEVTIDLLSDEEDSSKMTAKEYASIYPERMCLERAALLGLMPVERLQNGPPPLIPIVGVNKQKKLQQPPPQQQAMLQQQTARKRKSRPQKRKSLPPPVLLNHESIVLSDDSDTEMQQHQTHIPFISPSISIGPDLTVIYPTSQQIPCHVSPQTTMQVDEEVTISLVPRSLSSSTCNPRNSLNHVATNDQTAPAAHNTLQPPPFPMLPDETTVHTVIANRIYELSLTKLREGLASCGMPEFNGGVDGQQKKISPPRRKGAINPPPMISPPQAPISLKLSSDLSISLISDDEDDMRHHRKHQNLLSPAFLQKLPVNVSIAPVSMTTPRSSTIAVDPRKLKFG